MTPLGVVLVVAIVGVCMWIIAIAKEQK